MVSFGVSHKHRVRTLSRPGNKDPSQTLREQNARSRGSEAMSSHILLATVTGIALSTPAWAHDPAEAPIDTDIEAIFLDPAADIEAILLDPAEAPIDTEMKNFCGSRTSRRVLRENTAAVRSGPGRPSRCPYRPHSRGTRSRHSRTQTLPRIRTLRRLPAEFGLEAAACSLLAGPSRSNLTTSTALRERRGLCRPGSSPR